MLPRLPWILGFVVLTAPLAAAEPGAASDVDLEFAGSAADLPKDQIRASVDRELGRATLDHAAPGVSVLRVEVSAGGDLVLTYTIPDEPPMQRVLRRPERAEEVAEIVGLAAATLVRNRRSATASTTTDAPSDVSTNPPPAVPPPPLNPRPEEPSRKAEAAEPDTDTPRNFFGVAVGTDLVYVPAAHEVCAPSEQFRMNQTSFSCYDSSGARALTSGGAFQGAISSGLVFTGSSRLLISYDRSFTGHFRAGARLGLGFDSMPESYIPLHAELRAGYWFGAQRPGALRPGLFAGLGMARMTGHTMVTVVEGAPGATGRQLNLDAYASVGGIFVSGGVGLVYQPTEHIELEAALQVMAFPPGGGGVTPQLAARVGL